MLAVAVVQIAEELGAVGVVRAHIVRLLPAARRKTSICRRAKRLRRRADGSFAALLCVRTPRAARVRAYTSVRVFFTDHGSVQSVQLLIALQLSCGQVFGALFQQSEGESEPHESQL